MAALVADQGLATYRRNGVKKIQEGRVADEFDEHGLAPVKITVRDITTVRTTPS
jgi:hypothetical protein